MRYSRTISDKDKQLVSENRIQFRGHDITPDSLPGFTLPGNISQHFARDVIVPKATSVLLIKWKHRGSGFGFGVDPDNIESRTEAVELSKRNQP